MNFIVRFLILSKELTQLLSLNIEEDWGCISDGAKDLIRKMLTYEPSQRISATEAYAHPWILSNVNVEPLDDKMMKKLTKFAAKNKFRIAILNLIAN